MTSGHAGAAFRAWQDLATRLGARVVAPLIPVWSTAPTAARAPSRTRGAGPGRPHRAGDSVRVWRAASRISRLFASRSWCFPSRCGRRYAGRHRIVRVLTTFLISAAAIAATALPTGTLRPPPRQLAREASPRSATGSWGCGSRRGHAARARWWRPSAAWCKRGPAGAAAARDEFFDRRPPNCAHPCRPWASSLGSLHRRPQENGGGPGPGSGGLTQTPLMSPPAGALAHRAQRAIRPGLERLSQLINRLPEASQRRRLGHLPR